jgi:tyrosine-protein phosphatase SIW14
VLQRWFRFLAAGIVAVSLFAVPFGYLRVRERQLRNVRIVEDGILYRCGQPSPTGLERLVHDYDIRTVISFRDVEDGKAAIPPDMWEDVFCANLGIHFVRMPLVVWSSKDGAIPADENVRRFLEITSDRKNQPVLIHCFRGVHRTGTYAAIYRMEVQGWSNADAIDELKCLGYVNLDKEDDVRGYLERYVPTRHKPAH